MAWPTVVEYDSRSSSARPFTITTLAGACMRLFRRAPLLMLASGTTEIEHRKRQTGGGRSNAVRPEDVTRKKCLWSVPDWRLAATETAVIVVPRGHDWAEAYEQTSKEGVIVCTMASVAAAAIEAAALAALVQLPPNDLSILARLATNDGNVLGTPRSKPAFVLTCGPDGHWDFNDGSPKRFNPLHVPNSLSQSAHPEGTQQLLLKAKVLARHFYRHHD